VFVPSGNHFDRRSRDHHTRRRLWLYCWRRRYGAAQSAGRTGKPDSEVASGGASGTERSTVDARGRRTTGRRTA
jgi:hypothetical protein